MALRAAKSVIRSTCDAEAVDALEFKIVGFFQGCIGVLEGFYMGSLRVR